MVTRLDDIAHFAAMGGTAKFVFQFTVNQIPYIIPIALPVSCLISALILSQQLSNNSELTAMRASGLSLSSIYAPIFLASGFLFVGTLYFISEVTTASHMATRRLEVEVRSINPLLFLQNRRFVQSKLAFVDILGPWKAGEYAEDVLIAFNNTNNERLNLFLAKNLKTTKSDMVADDVTIIASLESKGEYEYDHLLIENVDQMRTPLEQFSKLMKKKGWKISQDYMKFSILLIYIDENRKLYHDWLRNPETIYTEQEAQDCRKNYQKGYSEILRRITVGIAAITFTLLGCAFGIQVSRRKTIRGLIIALLLAGFYLVCFFIGKSLGERYVMAGLTYFVPHVLITGISIWKLNRVSTGRDV